MSKPTGVKTQVDRWPLTSNTKGDYLLTVIVVAHFKGKPTISEVIETLTGHAVEQVKQAEPQ